MRLLTQVDMHFLVVSCSPQRAKARFRWVANLLTSACGRDVAVNQPDTNVTVRREFLRRSYEISFHFVSIAKTEESYLYRAAEYDGVILVDSVPEEVEQVLGLRCRRGREGLKNDESAPGR